MRDFNQKIQAKGVKNVRFYIPCRPIRSAFGMIAYTTTSDEEVPCLCEIDESRYMVKDNYKITLRPIDTRYAAETFYQWDLERLIKMHPVSYSMLVKKELL